MVKYFTTGILFMYFYNILFIYFFYISVYVFSNVFSEYNVEEFLELHI